MALDKMLLEILACPEDKGPLYYFEDEDALYNPRLHRRYRIEDDIPVMLVDESEKVSDEEHSRLMAKAASAGLQPTFEAGPAASGTAPTASGTAPAASGTAPAASGTAPTAAGPADHEA